MGDESPTSFSARTAAPLAALRHEPGRGDQAAELSRLRIFGLIETEVRKALDDNDLIAGLLPEGRATKPTGRNVLGAFQGLVGLTYTPQGIQLDRLVHTQRRVLDLLDIDPAWPEQQPAPLLLLATTWRLAFRRRSSSGRPRAP